MSVIHITKDNFETYANDLTLSCCHWLQTSL